ncbi:MAG: hypothetical protein [Podoviridae sp. ctDWo9]|nr:MAG: hypothetical protein [Podoviridae sp. ctDWo9]
MTPRTGGLMPRPTSLFRVSRTQSDFYGRTFSPIMCP